MERLVMKFGGSSLKDLEKIKSASDIILEKSKTEEVVVVVSAMGDSTNELLDMAHALSTTPSKRELDMLVSTGENKSAALLAIHLNESGHPAVALTGFQAGFKSDGVHGKNKITDVNIERIENHLRQNEIVVVTGFQGINPLGDITTFGRGGSDTSAVALAVKLNAKCAIYTDVSGIYSIDPRIYSDAKKLNVVTYEELMEMAHLGTKVIEPRSVELAYKFNVPMEVLLNDGKTKGTKVLEAYDMEDTKLTSVSKLDDVVLVIIHDTKDVNISNIFLELAKENVNVDIISHTRLNDRKEVTFTSEKSSIEDTKRVLTELNLDYEIKDNLSKVSIVGTAMRSQVGIAAQVFELFVKEDIFFYEISTSEISISYVVDSKIADDVVIKLGKHFEL